MSTPNPGFNLNVLPHEIKVTPPPSPSSLAGGSGYSALMVNSHQTRPQQPLKPVIDEHLPPRTKIICTVGPASQPKEVLKEMLLAGCNVFRLNFSHGVHEYHQQTLNNIREVLHETRRIAAILLDTKGPEIRSGRLQDGVTDVQLKKGQEFTLTMDESVLGDATRVAVQYPNLARILKPGDAVLIDDGLISMTVLETNGLVGPQGLVKCRVNNNASLGGTKGINLPGVIVDLPGVTAKDIADIQFGLANKIDIIAASFVRKADDVKQIRQLCRQFPGGSGTMIISKIENQEGIDNFDEILEVSDGIMVARGDLGVEIPLEHVALAQKMMIRKCNAAGKPVITATQMLESMVKNPSPTRAEASDVANAVLDGSDCVMLSGETAKGSYPVQAVKVMSDICREAEANTNYRLMYNTLRVTQSSSPALNVDLHLMKPGGSPSPSRRSSGSSITSIDDFTHPNSQPHTHSEPSHPAPTVPSAPKLSIPEAIASASVKASLDLNAALLLVLTETGATARLVSKYRPKCPIITITSNERCARQAQVSRSLFPMLVGSMVGSDSLIHRVISAAKRLGMCSVGQLVVVVSGSREATSGSTNDLKIMSVSY